MAINYAGQEASCYLAVVETVEAGQAGRAGCSVGALRLLLRVAALRSTGASVRAVDLTAAGLGEGSAVRGNVAECLRLGFLVRAGGRLELTDNGRRLVSETGRAWARAVRSLLAFLPVAPYPGVSRAKKREKSSKRNNTQKKI